MASVVAESEDGSAHDLLRSLVPGEVRRGMVTSIADSVVFVDLDGVSGVITAANLSWRSVDHPSQVVQKGKEVVVSVLSVDLDRKQVSLSLKDLQPDPFRDFARTRLGSTLTGRVTKVAPIGAFVLLDNDVVGFLPESEFREKRQGQAARVGEEFTVRICSINVDRRQVIVSLLPERGAAAG
ncbi:S1 RNA-binding domain-containing protein [Streptomyces sp. NPDC057617]|uniref:S1 RNA-binding domain-containing protein n=1 Tax=Streptomyces sp. NPDC057617 TaxID=3346184 RepID=UPI00367C3DD6